jgi:predicted amidophosphoribosyltransferase
VPCERCRAQFRLAGPIPRIGGVDWCAALLSYRGPARELVARAKFRNHRVGLAWLAQGMADLVPEQRPDVITWAPANPAHVRSRGFDHGELLARAVARHLGQRATPTLTRDRGVPLTGQSAVARHAGPPLRPRPADRAWPLCHATVLVIDDVITTGATLATAAARLRGLGASRVIAVAAAYTPAPAQRPTASRG